MERMMELKRIFILVISLLFISSFAFAETVILKSGKTIEGKILEKTDNYVKIDFEGTPLTYFMDQIDRIEGSSPLSTNAEKKKGSLILVGDVTLTYASYFFVLPPNWIPLMDKMELTDVTGYWHGRYNNSQTLMEIEPIKKPKEQTLASIVNLTKEYSEKESPLGSWQKYSNFKPVINYTYEGYGFNNSKKGTYELFVFIEIPPEYVIIFILTGLGEDEKCIIPYFDDFNKVISSFRWTLGLSVEEIGNMLKKI